MNTDGSLAEEQPFTKFLKTESTTRRFHVKVKGIFALLRLRSSSEAFRHQSNRTTIRAAKLMDAEASMANTVCAGAQKKAAQKQAAWFT